MDSVQTTSSSRIGQVMTLSVFILSHFCAATSPYVTSVGATKLGLLESGTEKLASFSGGGFSWHFSTPDWQKSAVQSYIQNNGKSLPDQKYWNAGGRGYPDVSAFGVGFLVVYDGIPTPVDGTR